MTIRFKYIFLLLLSGILLSIISCSKSDSPTAPDIQTTDLPVASPQSQNVDSLQLTTALDHASTVSGIGAVVVVRNDFLIAEAYYNGFGKNDLHHVRSVTKSITSLLTGIAIDQDLIDNIDVPMNHIFRRHGVIDIVPSKDSITIRHLLNMTSGIEWHESGGNEFSNWLQSNDRVNYVLLKPIQDEPGTQFNYNSGASHLLSVVLTQAVGKSTRAFAEEVLFEPLGITRIAWERDYRGFYFGGHGLQMRPVDMAKIGMLCLRNGRFENEQIVPDGWIASSTRAQVEMGGSYGAIANLGYGYLWWLDTGRNFRVYLAWGWGGQFIYCVPQLNLVVVTASNWRVSGTVHSQQGRANLDLIVNHILPAVN